MPRRRRRGWGVLRAAATGAGARGCRERGTTSECSDRECRADRRTAERGRPVAPGGCSDTEEAYSASEEASSATEEARPDTEEAYSATEEASSASEEAFPATEEACSASEEAFPATEEACSASEEACSVTEEARSVSEQPARQGNPMPTRRLQPVFRSRRPAFGLTRTELGLIRHGSALRQPKSLQYNRLRHAAPVGPWCLEARVAGPARDLDVVVGNVRGLTRPVPDPSRHRRVPAATCALLARGAL